jgi:hypothetical protein
MAKSVRPQTVSSETPSDALRNKSSFLTFHVFVDFWLESTPGSTYPTWSISLSNLRRIDSVFDAVNPWDMDIYRLLSTGWWGNQTFSHMNSIVQSRDTSGHSIAIFEEFLLLRFSADASRRERKIQSFAK